MLLLLAASASAAPPTQPARAGAQAIAVIRIERPAVGSGASWEQAPPWQRREVIRRGERGEPVLIRLIDYQ